MLRVRFEGTFISFFKDKSQKELTKQKESKFFFGWWYKPPDPWLWLMDPDSDPQHCRQQIIRG